MPLGISPSVSCFKNGGTQGTKKPKRQPLLVDTPAAGGLAPKVCKAPRTAVIRGVIPSILRTKDSPSAKPGLPQNRVFHIVRRCRSAPYLNVG